MCPRMRRTMSTSSATDVLVGVPMLQKYHTKPVTRQQYCEIPTGSRRNTLNGAMATDTPMQLGMVGLGRMGANLVRRLMRDGHRCVVFDMNTDAVKDLEDEGATGAHSLKE